MKEQMTNQRNKQTEKWKNRWQTKETDKNKKEKLAHADRQCNNKIIRREQKRHFNKIKYKQSETLASTLSQREERHKKGNRSGNRSGNRQTYR